MPKPFAQSGTVSELREALGGLRTYDQEMARQKALWGKRAGWVWLIVGIAFIGVVVAGMTGVAPLVALLAVVIGVGLVVGIILSVKAGRFAREDLDDRRIEVASGLLETVGEDVPPKAAVHIEMSFEPYQQHGQLVDQQTSRNIYPIVESRYKDTWFQAKGRLADGNRFRLEVTQLAKRKEKRKPKYTKANEQLTERIGLMVRVSPETYPGWQGLRQSLQPGMLEGCQVVQAQVDDQGTVRIAARTPARVVRTGRYGSQTVSEGPLTTAETLAKLFVYVYQQMQNCRGAAAQGPADTQPAPQ